MRGKQVAGENLSVDLGDISSTVQQDWARPKLYTVV